jgi:hypothetical protein
MVSRRPDQPSHDPINQLSGDVSGTVVQAGAIDDGLHIHHSARRPVT